MHPNFDERWAVKPIRRVITIVPSDGNPLLEALAAHLDGPEGPLPCVIGPQGVFRFDANVVASWDVLVMKDETWDDLFFTVAEGEGIVYWLKHRSNTRGHADQRAWLSRVFRGWSICIEEEFSNVPVETQRFLTPLIALVSSLKTGSAGSYKEALSAVDRVLASRDSENFAVQLLFGLAGLMWHQGSQENQGCDDRLRIVINCKKVLEQRYKHLERDASWNALSDFLIAMQDGETDATFDVVHYRRLQATLKLCGV